MRAIHVLAALVLVTVLMQHGGPTQAQRAHACWCSSWVHGADHGTTCRASEAACRRAIRETGREHTPCRAHREPGACGDDAFIDGAHYRNER